MSRVYILGGEQTDYTRNWTKEGKSFIAILREIVNDGLKEVKLTFSDIEYLNRNNKIAAFLGNFDGEQYLNQGHLGAFLTEIDERFYGVPCARYEAACASGSVALDAAISKIKAQEYDLSVVLGIEYMKTVDSKTCGDYLGTAAYYEKEAKGVDFPFPNLFGRLADEIINKYKLDEDRFMKALGEIAYINYSNAERNPKAQTRNWYMSRAQANQRGNNTNPYVGGRLAISDCSQVTDGAAIVFLASEDFTKKYCDRVGRNLEDIPYVKGWGHRVAPVTFEAKMKESQENEYILPWTRQAVIDAYKRADLNIDNIDFFETHDCFTSSEYAAISCFGITNPGEEYKAIEQGRIAFAGDKPINPSGGLIGCGHPVGASGVRMFLDLYKQVSRTAGSYQIKKAENGLMLNIGGSATTNYVFIVGK